MLARIVLCYPVEKHHIQQIAAAMPGAEVVDAGQERIAEELLSADIFCGHAKVPVDWDAVVRGGRLKWIQSSAAGMDHCLVPAVIDSEISVTSASGVLADQVAEHTIALMTCWFRSMPVFFHAQQKKEYIRRPTRDLTGRSVGIVGLGGVGRRTAEVLAGFRTRILATDMFPVDKPDCVEALWPADRLDEMLGQVDIVMLALPLNETTRGMVNAEVFAKMKPGSLLVNMARGPLVDHAALLDALESGHIAGALLDVTDPEPLPPDHPLWQIPNVIITPHVAGGSDRTFERLFLVVRENLRRYVNGEPMLSVVDVGRGY